VRQKHVRDIKERRLTIEIFDYVLVAMLKDSLFRTRPNFVSVSTRNIVSSGHSTRPSSNSTARYGFFLLPFSLCRSVERPDIFVIGRKESEASEEVLRGVEMLRRSRRFCNTMGMMIFHDDQQAERNQVAKVFLQAVSAGANQHSLVGGAKNTGRDDEDAVAFEGPARAFVCCSSSMYQALRLCAKRIARSLRREMAL